MKKISVILLSIFLSLTLAAQAFQNLNFEAQDTSSNVGSKSWRTNTKDYVIGIDSTNAFEGRYCMQISSQQAKDFGAFRQAIPFTTNKIEKYKLTGYLKLAEVENGFAGFSVNVRSGDKILFFDNMSDRQLHGTKDWEKYEMTFLVDESVTGITIGGLLVGSGKVWFDDIKIEPVLLENKAINSEAQAYLNEVIGLIEKHSIRKDSIDLNKLKNAAAIVAAGAQTTADCYLAVNYLIRKIGDNHSSFMKPVEVKEWQGSNIGEEATNIAIPMTSGNLLNEKYGYLNMPSVSSGDSAVLVAFADSLQNLIEALDQQNVKGWILDLRNNPGGNCWPMLAGIGPLLGNGVCGFFEDVNHQKQKWFYDNGKAGEGENVIVRTSRKPYQLKRKNPIAVLLGPRTASSGEVVAVSFVGNAKTKSFGEPTAGLTTGNQDYTLSDGAMLFLTTAVYTDRNQKKYGGKIQPDYLVNFSNDSYTEENDPVLAAAVNWLKDQK